MYKIFANNSIIFDDVAPLQSLKLIEPRLVLEENAAGSLTFTVPPDHVAYNSLACMTTELIVTQDDVEIWRGRIISEEVNFWKCKKYVAEGELAYLNDSIQPPKKYVTGNTSESGAVGNTTVRSFLIALLNQHNSQVGSTAKQFLIGAVTVDDGDTLDDSNAINRFTNYETTLACINEKLIQKLGGHLRIRHSGNTRYLDYYKDYSQIGASDQVIRFGSNLLDYVSNLESIDWVTAIVPRGKRLELDEADQPVKGLEAYTNVTTAAADGTWHSTGSMFVKNQAMVNQYGFISAVVDWDQVTDANILKNKAKKYLQSVLFDQLCLEISAVDLHYLNPEIETLKLQETVRCISDVHEMDTSFPITKIEIDLVNPSNTKYTLGTKVSTTLTNAQNRANSELASYVEDTFIPVESKVLQSAKANATQLINDAAIGGYASFIYGTDADGNAIIDQNATTPKNPTGLRVANTIKDVNATNRWLWTNGGLGHYSRSNTSTKWKNVTVNTAITMDGKIVADFITAGMIKLTGATTQTWKNPSTGQYETPNKSNGSHFSSFLKVYDGNTEIGHWGSDGIWIGKGSIDLGTRTNQTIWYKKANGAWTSKTGNYGVFHVDTDGIFSLTKGSIDLGTKTSRTINTRTGNFGVFHVDDEGFMSLTKGSITLGTSGNYGTYKKANGSNATATNPVIINDDGSAFFKYATLTQGCKVGAATINENGVLGNFGTSSSMAAMQIGDGTFGISVPSHYNPSGSWGGLVFGYEAYDKCHWGNTSCILWDAAEVNGDWSQGGFFVVRGDPGHGDNGGNYSKQIYNAFMIVRGGETKAIFNEDFYNRVIRMLNDNNY